MTRASLREYATVQRPRHLRAQTRATKTQLLDEIITVTGLHRKAAIRLLRRDPRDLPPAPRAGRPRLYGPELAPAAQVLWEAAGYIGAHRLHPFLPELLDRLAVFGALPLPPPVAQRLRQASPATLKRLLGRRFSPDQS